jgi:hypothetical protein
MKNLRLLSLLLLIITKSIAQNINNYNFSALSGTYAALSTTTSTLGTLASGTVNEGIYSLTPIGFDFFYLGKRFNSIQASTNGWASLGPNAQTNPVAANNFTAFTVPENVLAPLWDDLDMNSGSFRYQTTGTAPNRIFIAEWQNAEWNWNTNAPVISFQLKLFETTGAIQFEYQQESANVSGGSASIGIRGLDVSTSTVLFRSLNGTGTAPTASSSISTNNLNTKPASGQIYRFINNSVNAPINFGATGITINSTNLNWGDNSTNETGFVIYRSTDNVNFQFQTITSNNTGSSIISGLNSGTTYFYRIFALNEGRLSNALTGSATTLSGTLGGTLNIPGNYPTITAAINALRSSGIASNVVLQLNPTYNSTLETYPINVSGLGTSANRTLTIRPAATVTSLTISSTSGNRAFTIDNTSFVTIDGRPGGTGTTRALTISCPNGNNTIIFGDDCSNDTIRFCRLSLNDNNTGFFPLSSVVSFAPLTNGYINGSNNNGIVNNEIFGINPPNSLITFQGSNNFVPFSPISTGNTFSNNLLYDYIGFNSFTGNNSAVLVTGNASGFTINNNNIYQTSSLSTQSFGNVFTLNAIKINTTIPSNFTISGNFIGGSTSQGLGSPWEVGPVNELNAVIPIEVTIPSTSGLTISNNTIRNFFIGSSVGFFGTASFSGIKVLTFSKSTNINITGNNIGRDTGSTSINILNEGGTTQQVFGIQVDAPDTSSTTISGNNIGSFSMSGTSNNDGFLFFGISMTSSGIIQNNFIGSPTTSNSIIINSTGANTLQSVFGISNSSFPGVAFRIDNISILNNTVSGLRNNFASPSGTDRVVGIEVNEPRSLTLQGNTVQNLTALNPSTSESIYTLKGIHINNLGATNALSYNVNSNVVRNLVNLNAGGLGNTAGLVITNVSDNRTNIGRNFIHSLSMSTTNSAARMTGILLNDGECQLTNNKVRLGITSNGAAISTPIKISCLENNDNDLVQVWHNTFYVGGSLPTSTSNTFCINRSSNGAMNVTNNILVNARNFTTGNVTRNYGIGLTSSSLYTGNNNCYFKQGNGTALGLIGTTNYDTITTWRTATGAESASGLVNPNLVNPTGNSTALDLHVISPTPIEANGAPLPTVLVDFDGQTRSAFTPNDVGADAGNFTSLPLPVVWKEFTANRKEDQVALNFSVSQQINNREFDIERSTDGVDYTSIKTIAGEGNSNVPKTYRYTDNIAAFAGVSNILYYRIKQTDFNGDYSYSIIRKVDLDLLNEEEVTPIKIYPIPTKDMITIAGLTTEQTSTIAIYNYSGAMVKELAVEAGVKEVSLDLSDVPDGYYVLALSNSNKRYKIAKY